MTRKNLLYLALIFYVSFKGIDFLRLASLKQHLSASGQNIFPSSISESEHYPIQFDFLSGQFNLHIPDYGQEESAGNSVDVAKRRRIGEVIFFVFLLASLSVFIGLFVFSRQLIREIGDN